MIPRNGRPRKPERLLAFPLHVLSFTFLVPPKYFFELLHQLWVDHEKTTSFSDQTTGVDNALREEVDEFEEFVVGIAAFEGSLDAFEELGVV